MHNPVTWAEIPVTDMSRAINFYREVFGYSFKKETMESFDMAIIEADNDAVSGMLVKGEGYQPTETGAVVYFNGGDDLTPTLKRAENMGSKVLWPKTAIKEGECGYFAMFIDCEGNRVGIYSKE